MASLVPPLRWRAAALVLGAALAACGRKPPADLSRDPRALLLEVRAHQEKVQRVRGHARVNIQSPRANGSANEWIAAEKPDRLHLETLDFFGNVAAVLVADRRSFALYDSRTATFYRGEPTPENVSRLLPVVLSASELVTMLCGSAPVLAGEPISVEVNDDLLWLAITSSQRRQQLGIGEHAAVERSSVQQVKRITRGAEEPTVIYGMDFSHFRRLGAARFPLEVQLDASADGARVGLSWSDIELNGSLDEALFQLAPPQGAKVVNLSPGTSVPELEIPLSPPGKRE